MAVILFYSPFNQRSRDTETLMIAFKKEGHTVISLSQQEGHIIHPLLQQFGIETYSYVLPGKRSGIWYFFRHILYFIRFCYQHKVDIVYSHLEPSNFVASIGQYFIKAKVYLCRHHINESNLYQFDKDLYYKLTYKLAKKIIVVSNHAKQYMVEKEKIPAEKIIHINLAYNFDLYPKPNENKVEELRAKFGKNKLVLLGACRFTKFKRPDLLIEVVHELKKKNIDATLVMMGKGEMEKKLNTLISNLQLNNDVYLTGYVENVMDYYASCDFFLHPSLLESSCVVVKEAGLVQKPVIVCKGIGDFDAYLAHQENAFVVDQKNFVKESVKLIEAYYQQKDFLLMMGKKLHEAIYHNFSETNVLRHYQSLN
jgi:glycosyltransferase involved in cell wall biosynthesis